TDGDDQGFAVGRTLHHHVFAALQALMPGLCRHVLLRRRLALAARGADRRARGAVARQAGDPLHPRSEGAKASFAKEAAPFRRQSLQQNHGRADPGLGVRGAAFGRQLQVEPALLLLLAELGLGLDHAEQQYGQQAKGHGQAQAESDALDATAPELAAQNPADTHRYLRPAPLNLSASARIERMASPADWPSRA